MRCIAHLSDVHILDARVHARQARYRLTTRLVSVGRGIGIDPTVRRRRLACALALAKSSGADHFVISGDLTELGEAVEFEQFAEVLHDARLPDDSVTLVPGNHDAYSRGDGWASAMKGPLARFAAASATTSAVGEKTPRVVDRGDVVFLPIDSTRFQTIAWSGGVFTRATAEALSRALADPAMRDKAPVLVLHHPPFYPQAPTLMKWVDGLRGSAVVLELLNRHPRLQLLHGHLHRVVDRILATSVLPAGRSSSALGLCLRQAPDPFDAARHASRSPHLGSLASLTRVFGAPATCEGTEDLPRIRLYDVRDGALHARPVRVAA